MENLPVSYQTISKNHEVALKAIDAAGGCGKEICQLANSSISAVGNIGSMAINATASIVNNTISTFGKTIDTAIDTYKSIKLQKLQNELREIEVKHEERLKKMQYAHEEKMYAMQVKHEEFIISEQRKLLEKMIDSANAAYNKKVDFLQAQLNSLEDIFTKQNELFQEDIKFLDNERRKYINDATQYALISDDIKDLRNQKSNLYNKYKEAQGNLTAALQFLDLNKSYEAIGTSQINLLGSTK